MQRKKNRENRRISGWPLDLENQENKWRASWWDLWRESEPPHWFLTAIWRAYQRERSNMIPSCRTTLDTASFPSQWFLLLLMESIRRNTSVCWLWKRERPKQHTEWGEKWKEVHKYICGEHMRWETRKREILGMVIWMRVGEEDALFQPSNYIW